MDALREILATTGWSDILVVGNVPVGAGKCTCLLAATGQKPDEWVAFRDPFLGIVRP